MKFGKQIQSQQLPGWSDRYCDYKALKKASELSIVWEPKLELT